MNDPWCKLGPKQVELNRRCAVPLFASPANSGSANNQTKTGQRQRCRSLAGLGGVADGRRGVSRAFASLSKAEVLRLQ